MQSFLGVHSVRFSAAGDIITQEHGANGKTLPQTELNFEGSI